ncbi:STAS domain-containing protein [Streptomyces meridianus]|uniref:Anti-sigma factor antagonist n=1 Tax=Streptomyces meridianus TaxID=2938945 RepID=A0ABT0X2K2_9ACTN|nr:STAS domain-containing protein [Streptomyces meridianus]MCM2576771.1 STAS domain-containing protein [Streptomyces meridianus]
MTFPQPKGGAGPFTAGPVARQPDMLRLRLGGDLDCDTVHELHEVLDELLDGSAGRKHVVLDCSGLEICDSTGLSALLMVRRRVHDTGAQLHLTGRPPMLRRLLAVTGTEEHFGCPAGPAAPAGDVALPGGTG